MNISSRNKNKQEQIRNLIDKTSTKYFEIITMNIKENGYSDYDIENCCTEEQKQFLETTIFQFIKESNTKEKTALVVEVIMYYYFHTVLIETQYNDLLESIDVLSEKPKKYQENFNKLLEKLLFGDEPEYANVRKKFLAMNNESFKDTLTRSRSSRKSGNRKKIRKISSRRSTQKNRPV